MTDKTPDAHCKYCGAKSTWIDGVEIDYACGASECDGEYVEPCSIIKDKLESMLHDMDITSALKKYLEEKELKEMFCEIQFDDKKD